MRLLTRILGCIVVCAAPGAWAIPPAEYLPSKGAIAPSKAIAPTEKNGPTTLNADEIGVDHARDIIIARGHVEIMQDDTILTADQITYYQKSDLVVASGNVSVLQPTGDVFFSDRAELKDSMRRAVIAQFKARFADNSLLTAKRAVRRNSALTQLDKAAYTPCNICEGLPPFWQLSAEDAEVDDEAELITYRDVQMEFWSIPVFYTPYLRHPSSNAHAQSGFLFPTYQSSQNLGTLVKAPYYWRIGEDRDAIITPWYSDTEGPLLELDYTQLRDLGDYRLRGSITYPKKIDSAGNTLGSNGIRGHIFAYGDEAVAENLHVGFDIARASDETYLRRYLFGNQQALFSRGYAEYARGRNFGLVQGLAIQGLRRSDEQRITPQVLPILQGYYETPAYANGLRLHVAADAQSLTRQEGVDQHRLSVMPGATLPFMSEDGHIFTATVNLRQDLYRTANLPLSGDDDNATTARTLPQAALEWRYPLINQGEHGAWLVEPVVLGVAQTKGRNSDKISNEDSRLLELSDTNLFSLDRMPGLDLYDSGSRIAYGFRSHYYDNSSASFDAMLGQNYVFSDDSPFPNSTRAGEQFSDYIGRVGVNYHPYALSFRFALDNESTVLNRSLLTASFTQPWLALYGSLREIKNNRYLNESREGYLGGKLPLSENWSLYGSAQRDFERNQMVNANGGIIFKNECFSFILDAMRIYTGDRDIEPTMQYSFRIGFKNLGEFGDQTSPQQ